MSSKTITFRTKTEERLAVYRRAFEAAQKTRPSIDWSDWLRGACDSQAASDLEVVVQEDRRVVRGLDNVAPGVELQPPVGKRHP